MLEGLRIVVESVRVWFQSNMGIVFCVYGLAFVVMGVALWVQPTKGSRFALAGTLWLFVAYAFLHAPADFMDAWGALKGTSPSLRLSALVLIAASYLFLFEFGRRLVGLTKRIFPWWVLPVLLGGVLLASLRAADPVSTFDVLIGYVIRFPAGIMAGLGLIWYYHSQEEALHSLRVRRYFVAVSAAMFAWAFFCGIVRAKADFFPASWLNIGTFQQALVVPIYVFRTISALVIAWSLVGILKVFNWETTDNLKRARVEAEERLAERMRVEEALRETRDYLEKLLDHANAPIIVWDPASRITRFNRAFEHLTGYAAGEVVGDELGILFPESSRSESLAKIAATLEGECWDSVEIPILCKNGEIRCALWNSANIHAEDGVTLLATIAQGTDITERKGIEELKSDLVAMVSHELRTPLAVVLGNCALIERLGTSQGMDECLRTVRKIRERSEDMKRLVDELLDAIRIQSGSFHLALETVDLPELVERCARSVPLTKRHKLAVEADPGLPPVTCDSGRLCHALANLFSNAVKFSPEGGVIRARTAAGEPDRVLVSITDEGVGIPPDETAQIFDRFMQVDMSSTRSFGGFGMGLYIARKIVEAHGGTIDVASDLGTGSTFTIDIPVEGPGATDSGSADTGGWAARSRLRGKQAEDAA